MKIIVVANKRIRICFRDLPPNFSGVGADKRQVPFGSVLAVVDGSICLVAGLPVVAICTGMVAS